MPHKQQSHDAYLQQLLSLLRQPESWPTLDPDSLSDLVQFLCLGHGQSPNGETLVTIGPLYAVFRQRTTADFRVAVEQSVVGAVLEGVSSADALVPFIVFDDNIGVISGASLDLAVLQKPDEALGPFTGPLSLLGRASPESGLAEHTRAGILVGLVLLGDRRLLPWLAGCWRWLGPDGRRALSAAASGWVSAGLIDFFLSWLEQTDDAENFGGVLGTMCRMPEISKDGMVRDIERDFPAVDPDAALRVLQSWTFPEYYAVIRPRLKRIAQRESEEPRYTRYVKQYWCGG
jgi:hypothetical protein